MFSISKTSRTLAGSFKKLLEYPLGLNPSVWSGEKRVMTTEGNKDDCEPCEPCERCDMYDTRKFSKDLPKYDTITFFEPLPNIPTGVFRTVIGESRVGPCASKCYYYKNPEYYSYHNMSYYDFHLILKPCRQPAPKSSRKR